MSIALAFVMVVGFALGYVTCAGSTGHVLAKMRREYDQALAELTSILLCERAIRWEEHSLFDQDDE